VKHGPSEKRLSPHGATGSPPTLGRSAHAAHSRPRKRVLVLDDQAEIAAVAKLFGKLEHHHAYDVTNASSGPEAAWALSKGRPDLIMLDPQMKGLDGLTFLTRLRALDPTIPVIVATGNQKTGAAAEVLKTGVFAYMPKPCDFLQFEHLVALALP
jgi:CheY-like chemotaxis protein